MKIQRARLCLDCDELHENERCPKCASGAWYYPYEWLMSASEWCYEYEWLTGGTVQNGPRGGKSTDAINTR